MAVLSAIFTKALEYNLALCAVDGDCKSQGDEDDGVDIGRDHPAARRLGEHKLPADPAGEEGEEQPEAQGQEEDHLAKHLMSQKLCTTVSFIKETAL